MVSPYGANCLEGCISVTGDEVLGLPQMCGICLEGSTQHTQKIGNPQANGVLPSRHLAKTLPDSNKDIPT